MTQCTGFSEPHRGPRHERDAVFRCHKGASSDAAIKEQRAARLQSAAEFQEQMALMRQSQAAAQAIKTPVYAAAAPLTSGGQDAYYAGLDAKRSAARRFGPSQTRLMAPKAAVPISTMPLGGSLQAA